MPRKVKARVLIIAPSVFFYDGICKCLKKGEYLPLPHCSTLEEAKPLLETQPALALIGPAFDEYGHLQICRELKSLRPDVKIVLFTRRTDSPSFLVDAADAGVSACLHFNTGHQECLAAFEAVLNGQLLFSSEILKQVFRPIELTSREFELLKELARGLTDREIADELCISEDTVGVHLRNIFERLDVHSREEAVQRARQRGWV